MKIKDRGDTMVILASCSPRRLELLQMIFDNFAVIPADIDETADKKIAVEKMPEYLAHKKARYVFENGHDSDVVIGSDTAVFIDGKMLGKPKNEDDAFKMLKKLSGKTHKVITGCCVISPLGCKTFSKATKVEFYKLYDEEILEYIKTGEPMDKAGAYGIQGKGAMLVKKIEGDYLNVVGLPVAKLNRVIRKSGIIPT